MTAGFIGMNIMSTTLMTTSQALVAKSIDKCKESRGVFLGTMAFCTSIGVLFIDGVGGHIFKNDVRDPFYLCLGMEAIVLLLTGTLACFKQLNI